MAFKVSPLYKQKCSSCHGVNGEGIIGPKLIGLTQEQVLKSLEDFKSGARKKLCNVWTSKIPKIVSREEY